MGTSESRSAAQQAEIQQLKDIIAMQADVLKSVKNDVINDDEAFLEMHTIRTIDDAIEASAPTVAAWKAEQIAAAKQAGRDEVQLQAAKLWKQILDEWEEDGYLHQDTTDSLTKLLAS